MDRRQETNQGPLENVAKQVTIQKNSTENKDIPIVTSIPVINIQIPNLEPFALAVNTQLPNRMGEMEQHNSFDAIASNDILDDEIC